jgi:hypothetical protein
MDPVVEIDLQLAQTLNLVYTRVSAFDLITGMAINEVRMRWVRSAEKCLQYYMLTAGTTVATMTVVVSLFLTASVACAEDLQSSLNIFTFSSLR